MAGRWNWSLARFVSGGLVRVRGRADVFYVGESLIFLLPFVSLILDWLLSKGVPVLPDTHPIPNDCAPNVQRFAGLCVSGVASAGDDFLHLDNGCCKADSFALVWLRARCGFAVGPWPGLERF